MLDINKRRQFSNVGELQALLSEYFENTTVFVNGCADGYFHVGMDKKGNTCITLDCEDLGPEYADQEV